MTDWTRHRQTIISPEAMMQDVNAALGLTMEEACWSDVDGNAYAAASLVPDVAIGASDLPDLPVVMLDRATPLVLRAGHVHVATGRDGAVILDTLGLIARLPDV